jgi:hypothetical protein
MLKKRSGRAGEASDKIREIIAEKVKEFPKDWKIVTGEVNLIKHEDYLT